MLSSLDFDYFSCSAPSFSYFIAILDFVTSICFFAVAALIEFTLVRCHTPFHPLGRSPTHHSLPPSHLHLPWTPWDALDFVLFIWQTRTCANQLPSTLVDCFIDMFEFVSTFFSDWKIVFYIWSFVCLTANFSFSDFFCFKIFCLFWNLTQLQSNCFLIAGFDIFRAFLFVCFTLFPFSFYKSISFAFCKSIVSFFIQCSTVCVVSRLDGYVVSRLSVFFNCLLNLSICFSNFPFLIRSFFITVFAFAGFYSIFPCFRFFPHPFASHARRFISTPDCVWADSNPNPGCLFCKLCFFSFYFLRYSLLQAVCRFYVVFILQRKWFWSIHVSLGCLVGWFCICSSCLCFVHFSSDDPFRKVGNTF